MIVFIMLMGSEVQASERITYFTSDICNACQEQNKILEDTREEIEKRGIELVIIDIDKNPNLAKDLGWKEELGIPSIIYMCDSKIKNTLKGLHFKNQILGLIEQESDVERIIFEVGKNYYIKNDQKINMDTESIIYKDRAYIPVRYLANSLGISNEDIVYNDTNKTIRITKEGKIIELVIGNSIISINGNLKTIDAQPFIIKDRTHLPARFIAEELGYNVGWSDNKVLINKQNTVTNFSVEVDDYTINGKKVYKLDDMLKAGGLEEINYESQSVILLPKQYSKACLVLEDNNDKIYIVDWQNNYYKYELDEPLIFEGGIWYVQDDENAIKIGMLATLVK